MFQLRSVLIIFLIVEISSFFRSLTRNIVSKTISLNMSDISQLGLSNQVILVFLIFNPTTLTHDSPYFLKNITISDWLISDVVIPFWITTVRGILLKVLKQFISLLFIKISLTAFDKTEWFHLIFFSVFISSVSLNILATSGTKNVTHNKTGKQFIPN